MRPSIKLVLGTIIALVAIVVVLNLTSGDAAADSHYWDGEGADALFSTDANWAIWGGANDVEPTEGDDIYFWDWDKSCTWDVALTVGDITIAANYTGTVTQGSVDFGYDDFSMAGGVWTGSSKWQTCSSNWVKTGGTFTSYTSNVFFTNVNAIISSNSNLPFNQLRVSGLLNVMSGTAVAVSCQYLDIDPGGIINISLGKTLNLYWGGGGPTGYWYNDGTIMGDGTLAFLSKIDYNLDLGVVDVSSVQFRLYVTATASKIFTLVNGFVSSNIIVVSDHATYTMTLDLNGKSLSATSITVGARGIISSSVAGAEIEAGGILVQANGQLDATNIEYIDNSGNWDSSAGTWKPGQNQVNMTGSGKTVKLSAAQAFYRLQIDDTASVSLLSNVIVMSHLSIDGTSNGASYRYNVSGASETCFEANGTFKNSVYLNGTASSFYVYVNVGAMASVYSNKTITFAFTEGDMVVTTTEWLCVDIATWGLPGHQSYCNWTANRTAAGSVTFNVSVGSAAYYGVVVDAIAYLNSQPAVSGRVSFAYTGWSSHDFELNPSPVFLTLPSFDAVAGNRYYYDANTNEEGTVTYALTTINADLRCDSGSGVVQGKFRSSYVSLFLSIMADDGLGGVAYQNWTMRVLHNSFTIDVDIVFRPGTGLNPVVHFEFDTDCDPELFKKVVWNFGDGRGSTDIAPNHLYDKVGWYWVTCAVYDCLGNIGYETVKVGAGDPEDQPTGLERLQIWLQTDFQVMLAILIVGMVGAAGYQQFMKRSKGGANFWLIVIWIAAIVVVALMVGGSYLWG